jgi:hypothetical protein
MKLTSAVINEAISPDFSGSITLHLGNRLSVRLYKDARPSCLETASLHKGLVLISNGNELIEEGVGFGVPVAKYEDKTYFSSSAGVAVVGKGNSCLLEKRYVLDAISRKRFWKASYINDDFYSFVHRLFARVYVGHKSAMPACNGIMDLRRAMKIQTEFVKVEPRGTITFKYFCQPNVIRIRVDFSDLKLDGCQEILVLNEQGSTCFRKYFDTDGTKLFDGNIGAWAAVRAKRASLSDAGDTLTFTLQKIDEATLFRGWENINGRFSWAGLSYSLEPRLRTFNYMIEMGGQAQN